MRSVCTIMLVLAASPTQAWYQGEIGAACQPSSQSPGAYSAYYRCIEDPEGSIPEAGVVILDCQHGPDGRRLSSTREVVFAKTDTWCKLYVDGAAAIESGAIIVED